MAMLIQDCNTKSNFFVRAFTILLYVVIPVGAFLFPVFLLMIFIVHQKPYIIFETGLIELLFLFVPMFFIIITKAKNTGRYTIGIKLMFFGLILFGLFFGVIFVKVLLTVLGAFLGSMG
jgi:hypothetical protein